MPTDQATIVVVEDVPEVRLLVSQTLRGEGFDVHDADNGEAALALVEQHSPDLVVLDLVLPGMDGLEVCRRIREISDAYVVMLTAKDDEIDKVVGLSMGADDYMTKPFSPRELVARVRARLRRARPAQQASPDESTRVFGPLEIHPDAREVLLDDEIIDLTRIEFDILDALSESPRRVLTRGQLLKRVWGDAWVGDDHLVEVHVSKLRRKLGDSASTGRFIATVRGVGYRMGQVASER